MRRAFLEAVNKIKDSLSLRQLEDLLTQGRVDDALALATAAITQMADTFVSFIVVAGADTAQFIGNKMNLVISFDQTNYRSVEMMRQNRLRLISEFTTEQREATREALVAGISEGANPRIQARAFRDSIGLTAYQQRAVNNYRRLLQENSSEALTRDLRDRRFDASIVRALSNGKALGTAEIERMVERYQDRYLKYRSEVIARTEALRSAHQGTELMYEQAMATGDLDSTRLIRRWVTARDERVRGSHRAMNGQLRPFGVPFISGAGHSLKYPGDPDAPASEVIQCRCVVTTVFKEDL